MLSGQEASHLPVEEGQILYYQRVYIVLQAKYKGGFLHLTVQREVSGL